MKPVGSSLISLITSANQYLIAELFTFAFIDGTFDYYTSLDIPITYGGQTYKANGLRIEGLKFKLSVGFQVDEQDIKISAFPSDTLGGASFFTAVQEGLLDGGYLTRQRAFWAINTGIPYKDYQAAPVGVATLFIGRVSTIGKIGRTAVEMKLKSPLNLLDIDMPRNSYSPGCLWNLYDSGCTVNRASFTQSYTVVGAQPTVIEVASISPAVGADGINYYVQGRLLFTSGENNNLQTVIRDNNTTLFFLQYPLINVPVPGTTFTASAGCSKSPGTCLAKFANLNNYRGYPRVPPVFVSV